MAYSEDLAERVRDALAGREVEERKMFGGIAFMLRGNMVCGVLGDELIARLGDGADAALDEPGTRAFDLTGRPMRNFVVVGPRALAGDALDGWVGRCLDHAAALPPK